MWALQDRDSIRRWIESIEQEFQVSKPEIAARANVARGTIYRFFDDAHPFKASATTIGKIAAAFGVDPPGERGPPRENPKEHEAFPVETEKWPALHYEEAERVWQVQGRSLELAGYIPGDVIVIDEKMAPQSGDIVVAHVFNIQRQRAEYKLRAFEAPFLMARSMESTPAMRPMFLDPERVTIVGVVTRMLRTRDPQRAANDA